MPNVLELRSLVHYGQSAPHTWLNDHGFSNVQVNYYWSGTNFAPYTGRAWGVIMVDGGVGSFDKTGNYWVWPVQGTSDSLPVTGQDTVYTTNDDGSYQKGVSFPSTRFTDNTDGTVTDNMTGLMWIQSPDSTTRDWSTALTYCNDLDFATHTDWRLPTVSELETLTNYSQSAPATWLNAPAQGFSNVQASNYWSGTTYATSTGSAWFVSMDNSYVYPSYKTRLNVYVWPVRSGQ